MKAQDRGLRRLRERGGRIDGPKLHTRWGYIAWHLAGEAGLEPIAEGNSASELMMEVFKLAGPSVIQLDELVMFTRQLPDERFLSVVAVAY